MADRFLTQVFHTVKSLSPYAFLTLLAHVAQPQATQPPPTPAEEKLLCIVQRHEKLLFQYAEDPSKFEEKELEQRIDTIAKAYAAFNSNNPKDVFGYVLHGKFLREIGRYKEAYDIFSKAYELDPNLAIVNQQLGNHHAENGRFKEAYQHYAKAAKLDPTAPVYHFQLGAHLIYYSKPLLAANVLSPELFDKTLLSALSDAVRLDPGNRSYKQLQAEAYYDLNEPDWDAALQAWTKLLVPGIPDAEEQAIQLHRAKVMHSLGRDPEARLLLSEITKPSLAESKKQLLEELDGSIVVTTKPDILVIPAPATPKEDPVPPSGEEVNDSLIREIAALRKELDKLKAAPPQPPAVTIPAPAAVPGDTAKLADLQKQLDSASQKAASLETELAGTKETLTHKESTLKKFEENLKTYASTNTDLYKQLQATQKQSRELQQQLANLPPDQSTLLAKEKESLEAELAKEKAKAQALAEEADSLKRQAAELIARSQESKAKQDAEIASLSKSLDEAMKASATTKGQGAETTALLAKTKQELSAKSAALEKLRQEADKLAADLDLQGKASLTHQTRAGDMQKQNATLTLKLADAQAAHKAEIASIQKSLDAARKAVTDGKSQSAAMAADLEKAGQALESRDLEFAKLQNEATTLVRRLDEQGKAAEEHERKAAALSSQLAAAQAAHKEELASLQKSLEVAVNARYTKEEKGSETEAKLAQARKEIALKVAEIEKLSHQSEIFKQANADLFESQKEIRAQLAESRTSNASLKEKLDEVMVGREQLDALLATKNREVDIHLQSIETLRQQLERTKGLLGTKEAAFQKALANAEAKAAGDMSSAKKLATEKEVLAKELEAARSAHVSEITKLQESLTKLMEADGNAKDALAGKDLEIGKLQAANAKLAQNLEKAESEHAFEIAKLHKNLATAMESGEKGELLLAELEKAKISLSTKDSALAAKDKELAGLVETSGARAAELASVRDKLKDLGADREKKEELVKALQERARSLELQNKALDSQVVRLQGSLATAMKSGEEGNALLDELEKAKVAIATLGKDLEQTKDDAAGLAKALQSSKEESGKAGSLAAEKSKLLTASEAVNSKLEAKVAELGKNLETAMRSGEAQLVEYKGLAGDLAKAKEALSQKEAALATLQEKLDLANLANADLLEANKVSKISEADALASQKEMAAKLEKSEKASLMLNAELAAKVEELTKQQKAYLDIVEHAGNDRDGLANSLRQELESLRKALAEKQKAYDSLGKEASGSIASLEQKLAQLTKEKVSLSAELEASRKSHVQQLAEMQKEMQMASKSMEGHLAEITKANTGLEEARKALSTKDQELVKLKVEVAANAGFLETARKEAAAMAKELASKGASYQGLVEKAAAFEKENASLAFQLKEAEEGYRSRVATLEGKLASIQEAKESTKDLQAKASGELAEARKALAGKEAELAASQLKIEVFTKANNDLFDANKQSKSDLGSAQETIDSLQGKIDAHEKSALILNAVLAEKIEALKEFAPEKAALEEELAQAKGKLELAGQSKADMEAQLTALEAELEKTRKDSESQSGALAKLKSEIEAASGESGKTLDAMEELNKGLLAKLDAQKRAHAAEITLLKEAHSEAMAKGDKESALSEEALAKAGQAEQALAAKEAELDKLKANLDATSLEHGKALKDLQTVNGKLAAKLDSLQQGHETEVAALKEAHAKAMEAAGKPSAQTLEAVAKADAAQKEAARIQKALKEKDAELARLNTETSTLAKALDDARKEAERLSAAMDGQGQQKVAQSVRVKTLEEENASLKDLVRAGKAAHAEEISKLKQDLGKAEAQLLLATKKMESMETPSKGMEALLQKATQDIAAANLQLSARQEEVNSLKTTNELLNAQIQQVRDSQGKQSEEEKKVLVEQVAVSGQQNEALKEELKKQFQEIRFLNSELTLFEDNLLKLLNAERQSKQEISTLTQSLEQAQETIATLQKPAPETVPGVAASNTLLQEELNKQAALVSLQEKQLAELRAAQTSQAADARDAQNALKATVDDLGNQLNGLNQEKASLDVQLKESQATIASLQKKLAGNPYANLPTAPLTSLADDDLQVKLEMAQATQADLRKRLNQTNQAKIDASEKLVIAETNFKRAKGQLADAQGRIKELESSSPDAALKTRLDKVEAAFATYRENAQAQLATLEPLRKELEELKNRPASAAAGTASLPQPDGDAELLRSRLRALVESSAEAREALAEVHSALIESNKTNASLEAEIIRLKFDKQKLGQQLLNVPKSLVPFSTVPASEADIQKVKELEIALQQTQTKLDERERQFENVVERMNVLIARLKEPAPQ
jgi:chromosome segregation ATPase